MRISCSFFLLLSLWSTGQSKEVQVGERAWIDATTKLGAIAFPFKQEFAGHLMNVSQDTSTQVLDKCRQALKKFSTGLLANDMNAMALYDSYSKPKPGLLTMQGYNLGSFHQCLQFGRYFLLGVEFPVPKDPRVKRFHSQTNDWRYNYSQIMAVRRVDPFNFGICSPDECSEDDVELILKSSYVKERMHPLSVRILASESKSDPIVPSLTKMLAFSILCSFVWVGVNASLVRHFFPGTRVADFLQAFDAYANLTALFTPSKYRESMFTTVNLMRANYFIGSVYMHLVFGTNLGTQFMRTEAFTASGGYQNPASNTLFDAFPMVIPAFMVTNVVMASCFAALKWIPLMSKTSVSFPMYVMERVARTLPVVFAYFLVTQCLPISHNSGPLMKYSQTEYAKVCYQNGWKELLFINNFEPDLRQICNPIAWFMSAELQLYIPSFLIFLLIAKYPKSAVKIVMTQIFAGIGISAVVFYRNPASPILTARIIDSYENLMDYTAKIYTTANYVSVYAIGILLALKVMQSKGQRQPISYATVCWVFALTGASLSLPYLLYDESDTRQFFFGPQFEVVFAALIRPIASVCVALQLWLLMNTENSVALYLSRSSFVTVVTRLSLSWFMAHIVFVVLLIGLYENSSISGTQLMMEQLVVLVASFPAAIMMHVFVEVPFGNLLSSLKSRTVPQVEQRKDN